MTNPGPVIVVGRPRSGTRVFARILRDHGVFLGADVTEPFLDTVSWYQRFVVPLIGSRDFPERINEAGHPDVDRIVSERLRDTLDRYSGGTSAAGPWGWKYPETLFVMPLLKRRFPGARFVHVIRDVRDVCLSRDGYFQLTGSHDDPPGWDPPAIAGATVSYRDFSAAVTFGRHDVRTWQGIDLSDRVALSRHRFLIQAQSWLTCVGQALEFGRTLGRDCLAMRYEDFCHDPLAEAARLLSFAGVEPTLAPRDVAFVRPECSGGWRSARLTIQERRDFAEAIDLAGSLRSTLGYAAADDL